MPIYTAAKTDVLAVVAEAQRLYHPRLNEAGVTVGVVMAEAEVDENGDPKGPAIKHGGYPALAKIRVVPPQQRVQGMADAELTLDGDRWPLLSHQERLALVDHELTHLELKAETDDAGRPKLKIRLHDFQVGWFYEVAERHGENAQEVQQARQVFDEAGQALFPFVKDPTPGTAPAARAAAHKAVKALQQSLPEGMTMTIEAGGNAVTIPGGRKA